jgi:uncharacterized protein
VTFYTDPQRRIQEQFESRRLADAVEKAIVTDELDDRHIGFIASRDYFFLSTVNAAGEPTVSYKGGDVGTVKVLDTKTLAFPAYDGNGMMLSLGNISDTAKIGLLFIDFEIPNRIRVQATASLHSDDGLLAQYPGAFMIVRAHIDKVFLNCARYIHLHKRISKSKYVPTEDGSQPFPAWKRIDNLQGSLRPVDEGKAEHHGGLITEEQYGEALMKGES